MAWSERAREAAREARRRKAKMKVIVKSAYGSEQKVSRDMYAQKLRLARTNLRRDSKMDPSGEGVRNRAHFNQVARKEAGWYAAAQKRGDAKSRRRNRIRAAGGNPFVRRR